MIIKISKIGTISEPLYRSYIETCHAIRPTLTTEDYPDWRVFQHILQTTNVGDFMALHGAKYSKNLDKWTFQVSYENNKSPYQNLVIVTRNTSGDFKGLFKTWRREMI